MTLDKTKRGKKSLILTPPSSVHDEEALRGVMQTQSWKGSHVSESRSTTAGGEAHVIPGSVSC